MKSFFYIKFHSSDYISYIEFVSVSYDRYFVNCFSYLNVLTRLCLFQLLNEVLLFLFCCNIWIGMPKNLLLITNQRVRLGPCWQIYKQTLKKMFSFSSIFLKDGFAFAVGWYTGEVEITCRVVVHIWSGILNP